jgi:hypothetical protein
MEFASIFIHDHILGPQWGTAVASNVYAVMSVVFGIGEVETLVKLGGEGVEYFVGGRSVSIEFFIVYVELFVDQKQSSINESD